MEKVAKYECLKHGEVEVVNILATKYCLRCVLERIGAQPLDPAIDCNSPPYFDRRVNK